MSPERASFFKQIVGIVVFAVVAQAVMDKALKS